MTTQISGQRAMVSTPRRGGRPAQPPSVRNCAIYERLRIENETHERVAAEYGLSRQRVATIVAQVESWIAAHPTHHLAQKMRVRCGKRWETLWARAIEAFDRSRQDREIKKTRTVRRVATGGAETVTTITEQTVREQNGDPRYLNVALRAAEREDRLWMVHATAPVAPDSPHGSRAGQRAGDAETTVGMDNGSEQSPEAIAAAQRFAHLPAGLSDLGHLARGRRNGTEGVPDSERNGTEFVPCGECYGKNGAVESAHNATEQIPHRERNGSQSAVEGARNGTESVPYRGRKGMEVVADQDSTPVSLVFEQRCAEAFRCLGFDVRQFGQGCGRAADCLAVAVAERFAVIIDAKVRRRGYTLGTDDRQFCEYATRHCRELAQSGIERVYFAVVGHGFRQSDLDKLANFMTGTPIRSVVFIEAEALMRLVDDSILRRREFRLAEIDQLLFGNKILGGGSGDSTVPGGTI